MFPVLALLLGLGEKVLIPATSDTPTYRIDRTEVSIADYEAFEADGAYSEKRHWSAAGLAWREKNPEGAGAAHRRSKRSSDHPVVAISFFEAEAYCAWSGGNLPTNAQWSGAVCTPSPFPWGASQQVPAAWFNEGKHGRITQVVTQSVNESHSSVAGPKGLLHGAGNVWEWTRDLAVEGQAFRTLRGGSYANLPSYCRCDARSPALPSDTRLTTGIRCVYP
jgi:iron(II)-dependent oxidoreductase